MLRISIIGFFLASSMLSAADMQTADSLALRLNRIRGLMGEIEKQLDTLAKEGAGAHRPMHLDTSKRLNSDTVAMTPKPILGELLSNREKLLAKASQTPFNRNAVGYTFDPSLNIGMHYLQWLGNWGFKAAATGRFTDADRQAGLDLTLLRSLHRFSLFEGLHTHLYALGAANAGWRRELLVNYFPVFPPPIASNSRTWYEKADETFSFRVGAGTELGLIALGGAMISPEVGIQATQFAARYQDSQSWIDQSIANPGYNLERPQSDFSLDPYFGFHLSFYFR